jgi:hypothetical protein
MLAESYSGVIAVKLGADVGTGVAITGATAISITVNRGLHLLLSSFCFSFSMFTIPKKSQSKRREISGGILKFDDYKPQV